jgi:UDP-glucose 4-epimerase
MTSVMVTGGFGFIGGAIVRALLDRGDNVVILEHPEAVVPPFAVGVEIVRADITDPDSMSAVRRADIDAVLNLAGQPSGARSFSIPVTDLRLNALGALNMAIWCNDNDVGRLITASTFNVYGDHLGVEAYAEDLQCNPKSVYATSKLAAEQLLDTWAGPKGIRWNAMRMFNVYGPGQDITRTDQGVVGIFMHQLMQSPLVEVKGSLQRFRDLVYIDDVVMAWLMCLESRPSNRAFNVGTGERTTYENLIRIIARVVGKNAELEIVELSGTPGDMLGCVADMTAISRELGFVPRWDLMRGVSEMYEWVKSNH